MSTGIAAGSDVRSALRIAEQIRDEIRTRVGLSGLRLQIAREPVPLTIGLDDARAASDAVLLLAVSDERGDLATVLLRDSTRVVYAPADADVARAVVDRFGPALRQWLSRPGAS